nr:immunoglobulin heavy chain junction region [Macaca mulatta]MOY21136.1 immunoglobulin heavy chain junction region [Macaca mulatta]MOY22410.1 immunoglobulin heavy chain junction region [Macaca mulatta]MOY22594.1 immunoglobulin heavy chain junction region [Macaca mulatta]MOY22875.1 immunoglobulin heavy chain junction region [Macaca mulatta]
CGRGGQVVGKSDSLDVW